MHRWMGMLAALLVISLLPPRGTEIGKLKPAGLLYIYEEENNRIVETDTGETGRGGDISAALSDLKETTAGNIFLDTVDILVLTEGAVDSLPSMAEILRPGTEVCIGEDGLDAEKAAEYLRIHRPGVTILELRTEKKALPRLQYEKGRFRFE